MDIIFSVQTKDSSWYVHTWYRYLSHTHFSVTSFHITTWCHHQHPPPASELCHYPSAFSGLLKWSLWYNRTTALGRMTYTSLPDKQTPGCTLHNCHCRDLRLQKEVNNNSHCLWRATPSTEISWAGVMDLSVPAALGSAKDAHEEILPCSGP